MEATAKQMAHLLLYKNSPQELWSGVPAAEALLYIYTHSLLYYIYTVDIKYIYIRRR